MQTPEEFAWEVLASDDFVLTPHEVLTDLVRARDAEVAEGILDLHVRHESIQCGVTADVPHRHSSERRSGRPLLRRDLVCTEPDGHEGPHRDAICCYNFEAFTDDGSVVITGRRPLAKRDHSSCAHCLTSWPCETVALLNPPTEGENHP